MSRYFPIVMETEVNGAVSAYVVGLPVYAQTMTERDTTRAIRATLAAYLAGNPDTALPASTIQVARVDVRAHRRAPAVVIMSPAALLGQRTSRRKAAAVRVNGRLGGRPRTAGVKADL